MPTVRKQLIRDPKYLGGVFVELDEAYEKADYAPMLREFTVVLRAFHEHLFETEKAPNGEDWAPLAEATIRRKGHDTILHLSGALGDSLGGETGDSIRDVTDRTLTFGTSDPKSAFHDTGTSRMPARVHVGMDEALVDDLCNRVADTLVESLKG